MRNIHLKKGTEWLLDRYLTKFKSAVLAAAIGLFAFGQNSSRQVSEPVRTRFSLLLLSRRKGLRLGIVIVMHLQLLTVIQLIPVIIERTRSFCAGRPISPRIATLTSYKLTLIVHQERFTKKESVGGQLARVILPLLLK